MANSNVVGGLFGITPYEVSSQYGVQDANQAMQFAQLNPQQQGQYGMFLAGSGLGRLAGNVVGGGDPAMVQAQQMQQVKQYAAENNIDINTPAGLRQLAVFANQIGAAEGAAYLGRQAMSIEAQQAEIGLKNAQAVKNLREPVGTADERARNLLVQIEQRLANGESVPPEALNQAALIVQEVSKPKSFFDPSSGQMITQPGLNPLQALPNLSSAFGRVSQQPATAGGQAPTGNAPATGQVTTPSGITTTQVTQPKLDASTVNQISDIDARLPSLDKTLTDISGVIPTIKRLDLGLLENTGRGIMSYTGNNTKDRIDFDKAYKTVQKAANEALVLAKGTQTEGDADRAYKAIMNPDTWKNNEALSAAFKDLDETTKATKEGLLAKRQTLKSGGKTEAPKKQQVKMARDAAFNALKAANPNHSDAALNKKLDEMGY